MGYFMLAQEDTRNEKSPRFRGREPKVEPLLEKQGFLK